MWRPAFAPHSERRVSLLRSVMSRGLWRDPHAKLVGRCVLWLELEASKGSCYKALSLSLWSVRGGGGWLLVKLSEGLGDAAERG